MYILYGSPGSASLVVHWLLIELGVPYRYERLDLAAKQHKTSEYLALNPNGVVPTLVVDGKPIYECAALVIWLADRHADAGLAPALGSIERGIYTQWIVHMANTLQPAFRHFFYPAEAAGDSAADAAKQLAIEKVSAAWQRIDAHLAVNGPFLLGEKMTAADFMLTMLCRWSRNLPKPATSWPALAKLVTRMRALPSFAKTYELEGLTEWIN